MSWTVLPYDLPLRRPYRWAHGAQERRHGLLVRLDGGWGEWAPPPHEGPPDPDAVGRALAGLDGASPAFLRALDARAPEPRLRCALATAHLDAAARRQGIRLADLLAPLAGAPVRDEVAVNALLVADAPHEAARGALEAIAAGHRTLKVKCTADRDSDLARVAAVRGAAPGARIRLDPNGAWDPAWAADHLARLAEHGIEYVEDPVEDLAECARLRRETGVAVALDALIHGPSDVQAALAAEAADVVVLKPQRVGGPDRAARLIRFARAAGLGVVVTQSLESAVGRAAALHVAALVDADCGLATGSLLAEDVADLPEGGAMRVPGPGLGVSP